MKKHCIILGGTGYAAGELLRLIAIHPEFELLGIVSNSVPRSSIRDAFPHLAGVYPTERFCSMDDVPSLLNQAENLSILSALPHGSAAGPIKHVCNLAQSTGLDMVVVDLSADFRHRTEETFRTHYPGSTHGAPELLASFSCMLPELATTPASFASHPGCFTTAVVLASAPLAKADLTSAIVATAITGSTGSGKTPTASTHHPERNSNVYGYKPLSHRHQPEMEMLLASCSGHDVTVAFTPMSGPFARGIYTVNHAELSSSTSNEKVHALYHDFYADSPFVEISDNPPKLKYVVGTNRVLIHPVVQDNRVAVFCCLDNLIKGASGGGIQLLNQMHGLPQELGLTTPGLGWL